MSNSKEMLEMYLYARRPLIYIHNFDFLAVDKIIAEANSENAEIVEFSNADGRMDFKNKTSIGNGEDLSVFLETFVSEDFSTLEKPYLIVLKEIHDSLTDKKIYSLLQTIVQRVKLDIRKAESEYMVTVIIVDSKMAKVFLKLVR